MEDAKRWPGPKPRSEIHYEEKKEEEATNQVAYVEKV